MHKDALRLLHIAYYVLLAARRAVYYFIEPMAESDIERVQEIERRSFSTTWSANTYRHELRHPANSRYIVARASTTPPPPRHEVHSARRGLLAHFLPTLFSTPL